MSKLNKLGLICTECKEALPVDDSIFTIEKDDRGRSVLDFIDNIRSDINNGWLWCDQCYHSKNEEGVA